MSGIVLCHLVKNCGPSAKRKSAKSQTFWRESGTPGGDGLCSMSIHSKFTPAMYVPWVWIASSALSLMYGSSQKLKNTAMQKHDQVNTRECTGRVSMRDFTLSTCHPRPD